MRRVGRRSRDGVGEGEEVIVWGGMEGKGHEGEEE